MNHIVAKQLAPAATIELFDRVARRQEPRIARALLDSFERVRDRLNASELARMVEANDVSGVLSLLDIDHLSDDFTSFEAAISQAVTDGAKASATAYDGPVTGVDGRQIEIMFAGQNERVARFAQQISSTRIREIGNDVREVVRGVISEGTTAGVNPITTARRVRDSVGLTGRMESAVERYRMALMNNEADALQRELRDRRSDGAVRRAIRDKEPLPRRRINELVERYRTRYIAHRSKMIARTESLRSLNGANHELLQSYIDAGKIDPRQVVREWIPTMDERTRAEHLEIPTLPGNDRGVGMNEPFQSRFGPIMYPGDPNAAPANTINCRCTVFQRIMSAEVAGISTTGRSVPPPVVPPVVRPVVRPEPTPAAPTPRFRYQALKPPKNVAEAERMIIDYGVAEGAALKGISMKGAGPSVVAMVEMTERFGLAPLTGVGPSMRFGFRKTKNANAAIFRGRDFRTGKERAVFHAPTKFGNVAEAQAQVDYAKRTRDEYTSVRNQRMASLDQRGSLDNEVRQRVEGDAGNYGWSRSSSSTATGVDARTTTTYHEYGHVLHLVNKEIGGEIDRFLKFNAPRQGGWDLLLSNYANANDKEYVAEAVATYMTKPGEHWRIHPNLLSILRRFDKAVPDDT